MIKLVQYRTVLVFMAVLIFTAVVSIVGALR